MFRSFWKRIMVIHFELSVHWYLTIDISRKLVHFLISNQRLLSQHLFFRRYASKHVWRYPDYSTDAQINPIGYANFCSLCLILSYFAKSNKIHCQVFKIVACSYELIKCMYTYALYNLCKYWIITVTVDSVFNTFRTISLSS